VRPNPFVPGVDAVHVAFDLSKAARVRLAVRSRAGVLLATVNAAKNAGRSAIVWNGRTSSGRLVGAGTYRLRLTATDRWGRSDTVPLTVTAR
jgi:flagellar hook assembly protein FlgD